MLAAYANGQPDTVPVSPELWYDIPLAVTGASFEDVCLGIRPLWEIQLAAHRHYGTDAWIVAFPGPSRAAPPPAVANRRIDAGTLEIVYRWDTPAGPLVRRTRSTPGYYDWAVESPVKRLRAEMPAWADVALPDPRGCDFADVRAAIEATGEDGLVTAFVGKLFFDFVAGAREGGPERAVYDFADERSCLAELHGRYVRWMADMARAILEQTPARVLFVENGYATLGIVSPAMYRAWELPVVAAVAAAAHERGALLHVHQHGPSLAVIGDLADAGVDLVDPLERPPSGDVADLALVKRRHGRRIALRGNIHSHDVLLRGRPADVEAQVRECIDAAAGGGGYILATGDGAILGTPDENIRAMVAAGRRYGRYP